jgi:hypothetical protein
MTYAEFIAQLWGMLSFFSGVVVALVVVLSIERGS